MHENTTREKFIYESGKVKFPPRECRDYDKINSTCGKYYFRIWDFMIFHFNLQKTELFVYAIIFCMHMYRGTYFQGSRAYLAKWTNTSERTVATALKSLIEKRYIIRGRKRFGQTVRTVYRINDDLLPTCDLFYYENKNRDLFAAAKAKENPDGIIKDEYYDEDDEFGNYDDD